ncbi:lipopolysaccharide biosynthesis [Oleiphilus messinensis]|uniref:Lipopolysaccharide biosynthesis n=1 Tax=Oleiphilus messinensis TaxID=141451 RepID=A0A1Y0IG82_9GAMM|nr:Wzz/FepE/Etk N-terminal domain-containing protein [Oleiphilus messinensis]ARU59501.1 lipopolysaccharide biosynthesis [Oleiphilus messinensis]
MVQNLKRPESISVEHSDINTQTQYRELSLIDMWQLLWNAKWLVCAVTTLFAIASIVFALTRSNFYQTEVLLAPVSEGPGGLSALGDLGGLASLAGIRISRSQSNNPTVNAMASFTSKLFIIEFIEKYELLVPLLGSKWDPEQRRMVADPELYDENQKLWVRDVSPPKKPKPSSLEAYEYFMTLLQVKTDESTGLVTVTLLWQDPIEAQRMLGLLVQEINEYLKNKDLVEAQKSIEFLQAQLKKTNLVEMKEVVFQLIESQMKTVMLADVRDEYAFQTLDPAVVPERIAQPRRKLMVVIGTLLGGFLSVLIVFLRWYVRELKDKSAEPLNVT